MVELICPQCGTMAMVQDALAGENVSCLRCKTPFTVPESTTKLESVRDATDKMLKSATTPNCVLAGAAALVFIGFFLPWISTIYFSLSGPELIQWITSPPYPTRDFVLAKCYYLFLVSLCLLPLLSIAIVALELAVLQKKMRFEKTVTSLTCLMSSISFLFLFLWIYESVKARDMSQIALVGVGYWLTLIGGTAAVISDMVKTGTTKLMVTGLCMASILYIILWIAFKS